MAYLLGSSPLWIFLDDNGDPAVDGTAYFYRNVARSTRKLVYKTQSAVSGTGKSELKINGQGRLEWDTIFFDDSESYFIQVFDADGNLLATIDNYTAAGTGGGSITNFILEENGFSNGSFDYFKGGTYDQDDFPASTAVEVAPPSWYYRRKSTADPTETLNFTADDGSGLAVTQIGATTTQATASHYLRYSCTAIGTVTEKLIYFRLPSVKTYSNKQITISADMRRAAVGANFNVKFFYIQDYGSGTTGSGEQAPVDIGTSKEVTTTWQRFSAQGTVANVLTSGLTIDPSRNDAIYLGISLTGLLGAVGELHLTNLAVYIGDATGMDYRTQYISNASNLPRPGQLADAASSTARSTDEGKMAIVNKYGYYNLVDLADSNRNVMWGGDFTSNPWQDGNLAAVSETAGTITRAFTADGYQLLYAKTDGGAASTISVEKLEDAPTVTSAGYDYLSKHCHSVKFNANTYTEDPASLVAVRHVVEAQDMMQLGGNKAVLGFWVKIQKNTAADVDFAVMLSSRNYDQATARVYFKKLTNLSAQNDKSGTPVWVKYLVEIDTIDFAVGDWRPNTVADLQQDGLVVNFIFSAGNNLANGSLTEDAWQTIPAVNIFTDAALGNNFEVDDTIQIALPQLHQGEILPDYPVELPLEVYRKARRYYERSYPAGTALGTAAYYSHTVKGLLTITPDGNYFDCSAYFRSQKRITPTVNFYSPLNGTKDNVVMRDIGAASGTFVNRAVNSVIGSSKENTGYPNITGGGYNQTVFGHWVADARFFA
jgi:hypothetical protein